jgi:hypothetical protein
MASPPTPSANPPVPFPAARVCTPPEVTLTILLPQELATTMPPAPSTASPKALDKRPPLVRVEVLPPGVTRRTFEGPCSMTASTPEALFQEMKRG